MNRICRVSALAMLLLVAVVSPWLFGSVQPWAQLFCLVFAAFGCFFSVWLSEWKRQPAAAWLLLAILGISFGQLVALTPNLLNWLSPSSFSIRTAFGLSGTGNYTISIDPAITRNAIANLVGITICYLVAARIAAPKLLIIALSFIALNGVGVSLVGILQTQFKGETDAFGNVMGLGTFFGPFVNRNNAAGFLLLSLSASLALLLSALHDANFNATWDSRKQPFAAQLRAMITARTFVPMLTTVVIVCGILIGQSRGGILALLIATACTLCLALQRNHLTRATVVAISIAIGGAALLTIVDAWTPVSDRVGIIFDQSQSARDVRLSVWKSCVGYFGDFALTGSGLGTFGHVFRLYDIDANGTIATHAENLFVQLACEGGIVIFVLLLIGLILQFRSATWLLVSRHFHFKTVGVAWVFMLISQLIASCFDFGLLIPANMYLLAVLSGLYSGIAIHAHPRSSKIKESKSIESNSIESKANKKSGTSPSGNIGSVLLARRFDLVSVGLLLLACVCALDLASASSLESLPHDSKQIERRSTVAASKLKYKDEVEAELSRLLRNIRYRSDDAKAHYAIAEGYISRFELQTSALLGDDERPIKLYLVASKIQQLLKDDRQEDVEGILASTVFLDNLKPAYAHLLAARDACCLDPNVHLRLSQLSFLGTEDARVESLERMIRLQEGKRHHSFVNGLAHFEAGELEMALESWRPCLSLNSRYRDRVIGFALSSAKLDDLLKSFFPLSERFLIELAEKHLNEPGQSESREIVLQLAQQLKK